MARTQELLRDHRDCLPGETGRRVGEGLVASGVHGGSQGLPPKRRWAVVQASALCRVTRAPWQHHACTAAKDQIKNK